MQPQVFREMVDVMAKRGGPYAGMEKEGTGKLYLILIL